MDIQKYQDRICELFKTDVTTPFEGALRLNAFDSGKFKFNILGNDVYGYTRDCKVKGNQSEFTLYLNLMGPWNLILKDLLNSIVPVTCYYLNNGDKFTFFEQEMKVTKHTMLFEYEVPTIAVTLEINNKRK